MNSAAHQVTPPHFCPTPADKDAAWASLTDKYACKLSPLVDRAVVSARGWWQRAGGC